MKKILFTLILICLWAGLSAQSTFRKGIKVGDPESFRMTTIDSISTTGIDARFYSGSTELRPGIDLMGYVIEEIAGVVYARPSAGSTLNAYSGVILSSVFNSCVSQLTTGGKIYLKAGDYADNDTIVVNKNNIYVQGEGRGKTIIRAKASLDAGKTICDGFIQVTGEDFTIRDLEIDGNAANQTKVDHGTSDAVAIICGIESEDAHRMLIDNIYIHDFTETCIFATGCDYGKILNSTVEDGFWNGITLGWGTQHWVVDKNIVQGSTPVLGDSSSIGDVGIALYGRYHRVTNNLIKNIVGNRGYNNSKAGISLEFADDVDHLHESQRPYGMIIENNHFAGSGMTSGIANNGLGSGSKACYIVDNVFDSCQYAINFWGDSATIKGNKVYAYQIGSYTYGYYIQEGDYNDISENEAYIPTTGSGNYPLLIVQNDADGANYNTASHNKLIGGTYYSIGVSGVNCTGNIITYNEFDDDTDDATDVYDTGTGTIINGNYDRHSSRWDALTTGSNRPVTYTGDAVSVSLGAADLSTTGTVAGGIFKFGSATSPTTLIGDSISTDGTDFKVFDGATQLVPDIPSGSLEEGIALVDSTGSAEGNYMTRQNYLNDAGNQNVFKILKDYGSDIVALPIEMPYSTNSGQTLNDTRAFYRLFYLPEPKTITGVRFQISTQGNFTGDKFNGVALYKVDGTDYDSVAISANDHTIFEQAAATVVSVPFLASYEAAAGYYYVELIYNESAHVTQPILYGVAAILDLYNSSANSREITGARDPVDAPQGTITAAQMGIYTTAPQIVLY